jgi:hypothetical protein
MGKLALYGAVAGAGQGLVGLSEQKERKSLADLDAERQEGLVRLRDELAGTRADAEYERERADQLKDLEDERRREDEVRAEEQEHDVRMQTQKDVAAMERTMVSSSDSASLLGELEFDYATTKVAEVGPEGFTERPVTTVRMAGLPMTLSGNKYIPEGQDESAIQDATEEHTQYLIDNPDLETAQVFLEQYNYLPRGFVFAAQRAQQERASVLRSQRRRPLGAQ